MFNINWETKILKEGSLLSRIINVAEQNNTNKTEQINFQTNLKSKYGRKLLEFVKNGIEQNNGNYSDIKSKLAVTALFCQSAKNFDVEANLNKIVEFYNDFILGNEKIESFTKINDFVANYKKAGDEKDSISSTRDVSFAVSEENNCPVIYFGQRKEWAETHTKDTYLMIDKNDILFYDLYLANYDEFTVYGNGVMAHFMFDDQNKLTNVEYQYLKSPALNVWSDVKSVTFANGYYVEGERLLLNAKNPNQK